VSDWSHDSRDLRPDTERAPDDAVGVSVDSLTDKVAGKYKYVYKFVNKHEFGFSVHPPWLGSTLAVVKDPRVGALLVVAASRDPTLRSRSDIERWLANDMTSWIEAHASVVLELDDSEDEVESEVEQDDPRDKDYRAEVAKEPDESVSDQVAPMVEMLHQKMLYAKSKIKKHDWELTRLRRVCTQNRAVMENARTEIDRLDKKIASVLENQKCVKTFYKVGNLHWILFRWCTILKRRALSRAAFDLGGVGIPPEGPPFFFSIAKKTKQDGFVARGVPCHGCRASA
jgi:hypothetical protein